MEGAWADGLPQSPSQELQLARELRARKDFAHAAKHAASALASNPEWGEALALLDSIIDEAPDKEHLLEPGKSAYFGHAAGRARVLQRSGRAAEAIEILLNVIAVAPERGYEKWAVAWLKGSHAPIRPATAYGIFPAVTRDTLSRLRLRPSERQFASKFVPLIATLLDYPGCEGDGALRVFASGVYRRAGMADEAIRAVQFTAAGELELHRLAMLGLALRMKGDYTEAESAFRAAYAASSDSTQIVECAGVRWEAGDLRGALELADWASKRQSEPDGEVQSMLRYLRGRVAGTASGEPLMTSLGTDATPDDFALLPLFEVGSLEAPPDATVNVLRQGKAKGLNFTPASFRLKLSSIEAPSVRLVAALVVTGTPNPQMIKYEFESVPQPDPRLSVRRPRYLAWMYDGGLPRQACPPPSDEIQGAVQGLASQPYYLPRWWRQAAVAARNLDPDSAYHIVAAMVYPSPPSETIATWDWVRRVQFASAVILAQMGGEWRTSAGRQALLDLLDGPIDWVVDAAVVALVERALDDPVAIDEIASALERLRFRIPEGGHWSLRGSLPLAYLRLPGRPVEEREAFRKIARAYFEPVDTR